MTKRTMAAVAAILVAGGCHRAANVLEATASRMGVVDPRVVVNAPGLGEQLRYGEIAARREGRMLHVQVALENETQGDLAVEYRWEWTDGEGLQLGDTLSVWQPLVIGGRQRELVTGVGPAPSASDFRLYVRRGET